MAKISTLGVSKPVKSRGDTSEVDTILVVSSMENGTLDATTTANGSTVIVMQKDTGSQVNLDFIQLLFSFFDFYI